MHSQSTTHNSSTIRLYPTVDRDLHVIRRTIFPFNWLLRGVISKVLKGIKRSRRQNQKRGDGTALHRFLSARPPSSFKERRAEGVIFVVDVVVKVMFLVKKGDGMLEGHRAT